MLGAGVRDGSDGAVVELVGLEKVTNTFLPTLGTKQYYEDNRYSWVGPTGLLAVVISVQPQKIRQMSNEYKMCTCHSHR